MTLKKGQFQIGDIVFGADTNILVTKFDAQPYDMNVQDYQISQSDEIRFGYDSFKPTNVNINLEVIYNWLLPPFTGSIPNFWKDKPTVNDLASEWRGNDVRRQWGEIKPLFYCGRDGIQKMIVGRPGQFSSEKLSSNATIVKCVAEFRRADTLSYGVQENVIQIGSNTNIYRSSGNEDTWFRILVNGPASSPKFSIAGNIIQVAASIPSGVVLEISSYPWARRIITNTGVNLRNLVSSDSVYLDKLRLPVGSSTASIISGATTAYVSWRDAWSAVE